MSQREQELKIEFLVDVYGTDHRTACSSINYHQDHFGHMFDIDTTVPDETAHIRGASDSGSNGSRWPCSSGHGRGRALMAQRRCGSSSSSAERMDLVEHLVFGPSLTEGAPGRRNCESSVTCC